MDREGVDESGVITSLCLTAQFLQPAPEQVTGKPDPRAAADGAGSQPAAGSSLQCVAPRGPSPPGKLAPPGPGVARRTGSHPGANIRGLQPRRPRLFTLRESQKLKKDAAVPS